MKTYEELETVNDVINDCSFSLAMQIFKDSPEFFLEATEVPNDSNTKWGKLMLFILKLKKEIRNNNYNVVNEISLDFLQEEDIELDFLTSILINYHFYCKRKLNSLENNLYFHLLTVHKELSHHECVSVLTNICYKIGILLNKNLTIDNNVDLRHQGLFYFYRGFLNLVDGNYKESLVFLKQSLVLRSSIKTHICLVVNLLHLNENVKRISNKKILPYMELSLCVKNGNLKKFQEVLKKYKAIYEKDCLFEVINKLENNVKLQNFKKMSKVYTRIKVNDLINKGISKEMISTNEEIIHFKDAIKLSFNIQSRIAECLETRNKTKSLLKYKEIEPINYENMVSD